MFTRAVGKVCVVCVRRFSTNKSQSVITSIEPGWCLNKRFRDFLSEKEKC